MRTTLTLDKDVASAINRLREARGWSLKQVINEALREGLRAMMRKPRKRDPYRTRTVDLGACRIGSVDDVSEALAVAEGESFV